MKLLHAAAFLLLGCYGTVATAAYTAAYVFGDSLSDTGNVQARYESAPFIPGVPSIPAPQTSRIGGPGYYEGRSSNGPLYVDFLARSLGVTVNPDLTAWLEGGTNYAFGGARTHYQIYDPTRTQYLGLVQQAAAYLSTHPTADDRALYVVYGGSNNLQDLIRGQDAFGNPPAPLTQVIADLRNILVDLRTAGAQHFLVPNAPDMGLVPRVNQLGPEAAAAATALSQQFNAMLVAMLDELAFEVHRLDVYEAFNALMANADALGFTNTTAPCYTGDDLTFTGGGSVCANPDEYLFWDTIHPTWRAHEILADAALQVLAVPLPGTLALAMFALGALLVRRAPGGRLTCGRSFR